MQIIFQPQLIIFALLIMSGMYARINGLRCYQCRMTSSTINSCLTFGGTPTYCAKSHCSIFRHESRNPEGQIIDFQRDCEDAELYINKTIITPTGKKYYYYCSGDLCNGHNSLEKFLTRNADTDSDSKSPVIIEVPGIGHSSARSLHFGSYLSIIVATLISTFVCNGDFSVAFQRV